MRRVIILISFFLAMNLIVEWGFRLDMKKFAFAEEKGAKGEKEVKDETDFWTIFRKAFSRSEPGWNAKDKAYTEVSGVRGIEREGKMQKVYDWSCVKWMEEYEVKEEDIKKFLEERKLGPYKRRGEK